MCASVRYKGPKSIYIYLRIETSHDIVIDIREGGLSTEGAFNQSVPRAQLRHNPSLLVIDYFTRFVEIAKLSSTTAVCVVTPLKSMFRLASSVEDLPLVSARAAGTPKSALSDLSVPELIPLSVALSTMGIAL